MGGKRGAGLNNAAVLSHLKVHTEDLEAPTERLLAERSNLAARHMHDSHTSFQTYMRTHVHQDRCKHQVSRVCNLYAAPLKVR